MSKPLSKSNSKANNNKSYSNSKIGLESIHSEILKENLNDFFQTSKEKLTKLKSEISIMEKENQEQDYENQMLSMRNKELLDYNHELNMRIKGMKEKLLTINKNKSKLQLEIRDLRKEIDVLNKDIDALKIDNQFKVKVVQNEIDHTNVTKENAIKSIRSKILSEEEYQNRVIKQIGDYREEIIKYKKLIKDNNNEESGRNKEIIKKTTEMTKFLLDL
jgi:chromosome segregation ATPase